MKNYILLFLLGFASIVSAQDMFSPNVLLVYDSIPIPNAMPDRFVLGWQWGGHPALSHPMGMSYHLGGGLESYAEGLDTSIQKKTFNYIYDDKSITSYYAQAYQFEPTIEGEDFVKDYGDDFRAVTGFKQVDSRAVKNDTLGSENYGRLELWKSRFTSPTEVLSEPNMPHPLYFVSYPRQQGLDGKLYSDGRFWYFTINLRRINDNTNGSDTILKISLPYNLKSGTTGTIYFDSIPDKQNQISIDYGNGSGRGVALTCKGIQSYQDTVYITKDMLPKSSDTEQDITISAFFICEYSFPIDPLLNRALKGRGIQDSSEITKIEIDIEYTPNCDIAIDYIRLETPRAQMMFRGYSDLHDFNYGCALLETDYNNFKLQFLEDSLYTRLNTLSNPIISLQKAINRTWDAVTNAEDNQFFRIYSYEEVGMEHWLANRYLNKIFNNSVCTETNLEYNEYYSFVVEPNFNYYGMLHKNSNVSVPYAKTKYFWANNSDALALQYGIQNGYLGNYETVDFNPGGSFDNSKDSINSVFETWLTVSRGENSGVKFIEDAEVDWKVFAELNDTSANSAYTQYMYEESILSFYNSTVRRSVQTHWESILYRSYKYHNSGYFLFEDKDWWANIWLSPGFSSYFYKGNNTVGSSSKTRIYYDEGVSQDSCDLFTIRTRRPWTGEEINLKLWSAVLKGAKGMMYDRSWYAPIEDINIDNPKEEYEIDLGIACGLYSGNITTDFEKVLQSSDPYGGDFLEFDADGDPSNLNAYADPSVIEHNLEIPGDRFYLGRLSTRLEMKKVHDWINALEDAHVQDESNLSLMALKLVSYYSKGFRPFTVTDPSLDENILSNFVDISNITTRPIGRVYPNSSTPYYENSNLVFNPADSSQSAVVDSGFYDITLHRLKTDDIYNTNKVYLGVQNRRTDPLLHFTDDGASGMVFLTTAEFDTFVQDSGECYLNNKMYSADFWKSKWWKRLGCRELRIPINYLADNDSTYFSGRYYEIKELGCDNTELNSKFWRQPDLYHMIDTVIQENEVLSAHFLPGQGKLIEIEAKYLATTPDMSDTSCVTCEAINSALEVSIQETNDYCYSVTIINNSACDFIELNLIFQNERVESDLNYTCNTPEWTFTWSNTEPNICYGTGMLNSGEVLSIDICTNDTEGNNLIIYAGAIINGIEIKCDNPIAEAYTTDCCSFLSPVTLEESDIDCDSTGGCAWKVMAEVNPDSTCYTSYGIRAVKEDGTTEDITEDLIGDGSIYAEFCYCGEEVNFEFYLKDENDSIACVKELVDTCNLCDKYTIKDGLPIDPRHPEQELYLYTHIDELQVAYPRTHTNALWFKTIELNEIGCMLDKIEIEEYDMSGNLLKINDVYINESSTIAYPADFQRALDSKYRIVFYDKDGNVLCSYEFERHWELLQDNDIFEPSAMAIPVGNFCEYGIDVEQNQTPVDPIDIYYVIVSDMEAPSIVLHYEFRDPKSASPFDFSTSYHLTDLVKPIDSTLKVEIHYYDANFQPVEVSELTSSCMQMRTMSFASPILSSISTMPHPANDKFSVEYTLLQSAKVEFEIRNQYGTVLYYKNEGNQKSGVNYKGFDTSSFISGQYYLVIQAGSETKVIPFVVIH